MRAALTTTPVPPADLYGALPAAISGFQDALESSDSLIGIGTDPEAIEQNPVLFDVVNELSFRCGAIFNVLVLSEQQSCRGYQQLQPTKSGFSAKMAGCNVYAMKDLIQSTNVVLCRVGCGSLI